MPNPPPRTPPRTPNHRHWLRWTLALLAATAFGLLAIQLARVDTDLGAAFGPARTIAAIDASPELHATDDDHARAALRDRPVDGAAYRVIAQSAAAAGDAEHAEKLFAIAVARWPRDVIARGALVDAAFARDDIDTALTHLDALLRVNPGLRATVLAALMPGLADPRIRDGLLQRLDADPPWRGSVPAALRLEQAPAPDAAALLAALAERIEPSTAELSAHMALLERMGQSAAARSVWLRSLPTQHRGTASLVFDGGFEHPDIGGGYGWNLVAPAGAAIGHETSAAREGASMLTIRFDGRALQFAGVSQKLALPAGAYRLRVDMRNRVETVRPFVWRVACSAPTPAQLLQLEVPRSTDDWQSIDGNFDVPAGCDMQSLQLLHASRSLAERRLSGELQVDGVQVIPLD